jgi:O-acetyl-ADP-ribose deacetylase
VIHTVGPVYSVDTDRSDELRSCYRQALAVAAELDALTVAFPLISAGAYGWPAEDALRIALNELRVADRSATLVLYSADLLSLARRLAP